VKRVKATDENECREVKAAKEKRLGERERERGKGEAKIRSRELPPQQEPSFSHCRTWAQS
jgi:hypothetical protein